LKPDGTGWTGWEQHVLIENGPDVHVTMHTLENQGQNYSVIVTGKARVWITKPLDDRCCPGPPSNELVPKIKV
jgi:hypothetical protein